MVEEKVNNFNKSDDLSWVQHIMQSQRMLNNVSSFSEIKKIGHVGEYSYQMYTSVEGTLTGCIVAWFRNLNTQEWSRLLRMVDIALTITGTDLPTIKGIYRKCCLKKAANIIIDSHYFGHAHLEA